MQLILFTAFLLFWGFACSNIAKKKNRKPNNWFLLGILFGIFALIVIIFLKPLKITKTIIEPKQAYHPILENDKNYWYYLDLDNKQIGPMSLKKIFEIYSNGKISNDTFVWNDTLDNWKRLKEISNFSELAN